MIEIKVDGNYELIYTSGWDARMSDLNVNPYAHNRYSNEYQAWCDGWEDADIELRSDGENNGYDLV